MHHKISDVVYACLHDETLSLSFVMFVFCMFLNNEVEVTHRDFVMVSIVRYCKVYHSLAICLNEHNNKNNGCISSYFFENDDYPDLIDIMLVFCRENYTFSFST